MLVTFQSECPPRTFNEVDIGIFKSLLFNCYFEYWQLLLLSVLTNLMHDKHTCRKAMRGLLHSCHGNKSPSLSLCQCFEIHFRFCFGPICVSFHKNMDKTALTRLSTHTSWPHFWSCKTEYPPSSISICSTNQSTFCAEVVIKLTFNLSWHVQSLSILPAGG